MDQLESLTPTECRIVRAIYDGKRNREIATELRIKEGTVKTYVSHILAKLKFRSRVEIVRWLAPILGVLLLAAVSHAQPKLSQVVTATTATVNLAGGGMNPSSLEVSVTVPAGATIAPGPGLAGAGKTLAYFIPASGPAMLVVYGGQGAIPDGALAVISLPAPFVPAMSLPIAVDANSNGITISISGGACDLNGDGSVTLADVQISVDQALGKSACSNDLNGDGKCTVLDVQRVVNAAAGGACKAGA